MVAPGRHGCPRHGCPLEGGCPLPAARDAGRRLRDDVLRDPPSATSCEGRVCPAPSPDARSGILPPLARHRLRSRHPAFDDQSAQADRCPAYAGSRGVGSPSRHDPRLPWRASVFGGRLSPAAARGTSRRQRGLDSRPAPPFHRSAVSPVRLRLSASVPFFSPDVAVRRASRWSFDTPARQRFNFAHVPPFSPSHRPVDSAGASLP